MEGFGRTRAPVERAQLSYFVPGGYKFGDDYCAVLCEGERPMWSGRFEVLWYTNREMCINQLTIEN
jgi:hypothetical protein